MICIRGIIHNLIAILLVLIILSTCSITAHATDYKTISYKSFRNRNITSIHIGSDVDEITPGALRNMPCLNNITVSEKNHFYSSYSGCLYNKTKTELICFPAGLTEAYIPNTVTYIEDYALNGVSPQLRAEIEAAVEGNSTSNNMEWDIHGEHFIHIDGTVKWQTADGEIIPPRTEVMSRAADIVRASTTVYMTQGEQLEKSFNHLAKSITYERSNDVPTGDWVPVYALNTFDTRTGNCYGYAAAFAYIAKGLGYDSRVCTGTVTSSLGGRTPHAWTEVKIGNKWYIFDAEMQNAKGSGYYKQTYDSYPAGPLILEAVYSVSF